MTNTKYPKIKDSNFFEVDANTLAKELLGKILVVHFEENNEKFDARFRIRETVAFTKGAGENSQTQNLKGGHIYSRYVRCGQHPSWDIVAGKEDDSESVLIYRVDCFETTRGPLDLITDNANSINSEYLPNSKKIELFDDGSKVIYRNEEFKNYKGAPHYIIEVIKF